jgi:hypothetical protein
MYTTLWQFFKDNIVKNDIIGIEGQRLGNIIRSYCDPVEDRIPHDLYLLRDLFGDKILENLTIERNSTHPKLRASLASGDSKIGIDLGFDDLEVSFWEVSTLDVMTTLDFRSHSYRERNLTKSFAQDQKIALPRMLEAFLGFKPETCRNQALIHCLRNLFYYPISRNSL